MEQSSKLLRTLDVWLITTHNHPVNHRVPGPVGRKGALSSDHDGSYKMAHKMRFLRKLYEYWMAFGHAIGVIMTPLQLLLIYVLVFGPARLITKVMGLDLLDRKLSPRVSFWSPKEPAPHTVESSRRQF